MKQEVLFIILNEYADWESAFVAASLHSGLMPGSEIKYVVKTVAEKRRRKYSLYNPGV